MSENMVPAYVVHVVPAEIRRKGKPALAQQRLLMICIPTVPGKESDDDIFIRHRGGTHAGPFLVNNGFCLTRKTIAEHMETPVFRVGEELMVPRSMQRTAQQYALAQTAFNECITDERDAFIRALHRQPPAHVKTAQKPEAARNDSVLDGNFNERAQSAWVGSDEPPFGEEHGPLGPRQSEPPHTTRPRLDFRPDDPDELLADNLDPSDV